MTPGNFPFFLPHLCQFDVQYILIGGGAAVAHGAARATYDVDVVYERTEENYTRIVTALRDSTLYYRGAPPGLPFRFDEAMLRSGLNFTFTSSHGDIDLLGEVAGGGTYESLLPDSVRLNLFEATVWVVGLPRLIELKRAAGRPKDFETIAELETLLDER